MSKKHQQKIAAVQPELEDRPWQVWAVRALSVAALATCLIADNGSTTLSSLSKVAVLQLIIGALVAVWIPLALADRRYRPDWRSPLVWGSAVFMAGLALSLLGSIDPYRSFWSTAYRLAGVFNYFHYWAWFIVLVATHRGWRDWKPLLAWSTYIAVVVDVVGFLRLANAAEHTRLVSTIDNALYLAAYLILQFFVALVLVARAEGRGAKIGWGAVAALHFAALIATGSRSTAAAALLGLGLIAFLLILKRLHGRQRLLAVGGAALAGFLLLGAVLWLRAPAGTGVAEKLPFAVKRIILTQDFGSDRAALADIAWSAFRERPVFGWGIDQFETAFEHYYEPVGRHQALTESWYDRAHNQFAEFLATTGAVGTLAYLLLWTVTFWTLVRRLRKRDGDANADTILLGGLVAYLASLFFSFDMPGPMTVHWLILAAVVGVELPRPQGPPLPKIEWATTLSVAALLIALILEGRWSLRPYAQARTVKNQCERLAVDPSAMSDLKAVSDRRTFATPELRFQMMTCADAVTQNSKTTPEQLRAVVSELAAILDQARADRPYDYKSNLASGFGWMQYSRLEPSAVAKAEESLKAAIEIAPRRYRTYDLLGELYASRDDYAAAGRTYRQASELIAIPPERGRLAMRAADAYARADQVDEALVSLGFAGRQEGYARAVEPNAALSLAANWPEGRAVTDDVLKYLNDVVARHGRADLYAAKFHVLRKSGAPRAELEPIVVSMEGRFPELAARLRALLP